MRNSLLILLVPLLLLLNGCGYNDIQAQDERIKAAWSEVLNQYQRRADLIPNLVEAVKGAANFEQQTLTQLTEARAQIGTLKASPDLLKDPKAFEQFQQVQGGLTNALSRLLVVVENYPQLKANNNFRDLQAQLEGTENRISVARNRYTNAIQEYNTTIRSFPSNLTAMIFGYSPRPNFSVEDEKTIAKPPAVKFDTPKPASTYDQPKYEFFDKPKGDGNKSENSAKTKEK